jgi:hypothetical protein
LLIKKEEIIVYCDNVTILDQIIEGKADLMIPDAIETALQQKLPPQPAAVRPEKPFTCSERGFLMPPGHRFQGLHGSVAPSCPYEWDLSGNLRQEAQVSRADGFVGGMSGYFQSEVVIEGPSDCISYRPIYHGLDVEDPFPDLKISVNCNFGLRVRSSKDWEYKAPSTDRSR